MKSRQSKKGSLGLWGGFKKKQKKPIEEKIFEWEFRQYIPIDCHTFGYIFKPFFEKYHFGRAASILALFWEEDFEHFLGVTVRWVGHKEMAMPHFQKKQQHFAVFSWKKTRFFL